MEGEEKETKPEESGRRGYGRGGGGVMKGEIETQPESRRWGGGRGDDAVCHRLCRVNWVFMTDGKSYRNMKAGEKQYAE